METVMVNPQDLRGNKINRLLEKDFGRMFSFQGSSESEEIEISVV
jgi:hypothetical protein